jgi:hypothetical protein
MLVVLDASGNFSFGSIADPAQAEVPARFGSSQSGRAKWQAYPLAM